MTVSSIPISSPVAAPPKEVSSLSEQINAATRPAHTRLNRLIISRLPFALPPYSAGPSAYIAGLLHIAPIYDTFESSWQNMLEPSLPSTTPGRTPTIDTCDPEALHLDLGPTATAESLLPSQIHRPRVCGRTLSIISHLRLPGLLRSGRLRADIRTLSAIPDHEIDDQLEHIISEGSLSDFVVRIKSSLEEKPHVLIAYAWVFYMAIFSGGRFLRAELSTAGPKFWATAPIDDSAPVSQTSHFPSQTSDVRSDEWSGAAESGRSSIGRAAHSESCIAHLPPVLGLSFFNFLGDEDGEDIKREFKKRLLETEVLLTQSEREDIVQEARAIFDHMISLVCALDEACGTTEPNVENVNEMRRSVGTRPKDGVLLAQGRKQHSVGQSHELVGNERGDGRRARFLEILVMAPLGKLIHFGGVVLSSKPLSWSTGIRSIRTPLGEKFSKVGTTDLDTRSIFNGPYHGSDISRQLKVGTVGAFLMLASVFLLLAALLWCSRNRWIDTLVFGMTK